MSDIEVRIRSIFDGAGLDAAQAKLQQFAQTSLNPQAFKQFSIGIAQVQKDFSNLAVLDKNFFQGVAIPAGHTQSIEKATTALKGMGLSVNQANYAINNLNQPTGQLVKNLNVVEQQAEKTGKAIGGFTGYLLRHVAYMGMFMAIYGLVNVFSEISRNAMEEATALNKLDAVLATVTSSHQLATAQVHDFAQSIAVTTLITQHQAIDAYQRFIALGASVAGAFDLVTSAVNLAAARNISLEFATEALARGMEGQYTRLTRLGVVTKDASGKALDFEQILGKLNEQFAGVAADQMDGYVGQLKAFSAAMVEATEVVGNFWNELKGKVATTFLSVLKTAGALDFSGSFAAYRAQLATLQQLREAAVAAGGYVPLNKVNLSTEQLDKQIAEIQKIIDLYDKYKSIGEKNSTITLKIIDLEEQRSPIQEEVNRLVQEEIDLRTKLLGLKPLETAPPPEKTISGIYASGFADYGSQLQKLMKVEAPPLIDLYKNIFATGDLEKNQEQLEKTKNKLKEIDDELARIKHDAWTLGNLDKYFPDLQGFTPKITEEKAKSIIETLNTQKKYYQTLLDIEEAEGDISGIQKRKNELQGALQVLKMFYEQQLALDSTNRDYLQGLADVKLKLAEIEAAAEKVKEANAKAFVDYTVSHAEFQLDIGTGTRENVITKLKGQLQFVQDELSKLTPGTAEWAEKLQEVDGILKLIDGQYKGIADDAAKIVSLSQQHVAAMAELGEISKTEYLGTLKEDLAAAEAELKKLTPDTLPWKEQQAVVDELKDKIANVASEIAAAAKETIRAKEEMVSLGIEIDIATAKAAILTAQLSGSAAALSAAEANLAAQEARMASYLSGLAAVSVAEGASAGASQAKLVAQNAQNKLLADQVAKQEAVKRAVAEAAQAAQRAAEAAQQGAEMRRRTAEAAEREARALRDAQVGYATSHGEYLVRKAKLGVGDPWEAEEALRAALTAEEAYYRALAVQTAGTVEMYQYLQRVESVELRRLELEQAITREMEKQTGMFNLPEFVRYGLPQNLAGTFGGGGYGNAPGNTNVNVAAPQFTFNVTAGGSDLTSSSLNTMIRNQINQWGNALGSGIRSAMQ